MGQVEPPIVAAPYVQRRRNRGRGQMMVAGRYKKSDGFPPMIEDVYRPDVPERLFGVEKDIDTINREFREHREESIRHGERWATKEHLADLEKDIMSKLTEISKRLDKRVGFQVLQTVGLVASLLYAVILSYKHFIQP